MVSVDAAIDLSSLPRADLTDDGGSRLDALLLVTDDVARAVRTAVADGFAVMPAGGLTSAIRSFEYDRKALEGFRDVVAIRPKSALTPELVDPATPTEALRTHQVAIDPDAGTVTVGAGVTFEQVNALLAGEVAHNARVLVDLTSVGSAFAGGVMATGGMGPLRLRPHETCEALCVADGEGLRVLTGEDILLHQGMQGWTGMATAVRMRFFLVPRNEFGLVLPVQGGDVDALADLLAYLEPWTRITLPAEGNVLAGVGADNTLLNGIELVGRASLEAFAETADEPARSKAEGLLQGCDLAHADTLVCLTGWSDVPVDEVLFALIDEETETIGGVTIDFGVGFSSGTEMDAFRAIREGAPDMARTRARTLTPGWLRPWSTSTDVNIVAPRDGGAIAAILSCYADYRAQVADIADRFRGRVEVEMTPYGHLSPQGIDPHHRVTLRAPEGGERDLAEARAAVAEAKQGLMRALVAAAEATGCAVTGGEKGIPSAVAIMRAVGGDNRLPANLRDQLRRARLALAEAPAAFRFRAAPELA